MTALLFAAVSLYLFVCLGLFVFQRSLIYFPQPRLNHEGITIITFQTGKERIFVSTRPVDGREALIYFGGNAEDVSQNMPDLVTAFPNRAIYLLHYRGYGGSTGRPSEKALTADALLLFDQVSTMHSKILLIGRSLGSGIAVHLASLRSIERLVLVTPYDSLQEVAAALYPFLPLKWILRDKFESWRYAPNVTAPTTIIAAERDEVIPPANTRLLATRFRPGVALFNAIPGADHNSISESSEYYKVLKSLN